MKIIPLQSSRTQKYSTLLLWCWLFFLFFKSLHRRLIPFPPLLTIRIYSFSYPKKTRSFFCSFLSDSLLCSGSPSPLIRLSSSRLLLNTHSILRSLLASSLHVPSRLDYSPLSLSRSRLLFVTSSYLPPFYQRLSPNPHLGQSFVERASGVREGVEDYMVPYVMVVVVGCGCVCVCLLARGSLWLNLEDGIRASPPPCNN